MLSLRSNVAGRLTLRGESEATFGVKPWMSTEDEGGLAKPYSDGLPSQTTQQLLTTSFLARRAKNLAQCPSDTVGPNFWLDFCRMASELESYGCLNNPIFSIAHLDLAPRNILINLAVHADVPIISGILDWDSAVLGPQVLSCAPPMWLWAWQDNEDEDERKANDTPPTARNRELKKLFQEAAGPEYMRLAYGEENRLARRLIRFDIDGLQSNEDFKEAESMLAEWRMKSGQRPQEGIVLVNEVIRLNSPEQEMGESRKESLGYMGVRRHR